MNTLTIIKDIVLLLIIALAASGLISFFYELGRAIFIDDDEMD